MSQVKEICQTESDLGDIAKQTLNSILDPEQHGDFDKNMHEMDQALRAYDEAGLTAHENSAPVLTKTEPLDP